mmetsp:Transcript_14618/g.36757  ORF Transcript_14618/g.36757 Transcript_14618/m.36757 type:complete len:270 (+) Transcript_14618:1126-1935(+)
MQADVQFLNILHVEINVLVSILSHRKQAQLFHVPVIANDLDLVITSEIQESNVFHGCCLVKLKDQDAASALCRFLRGNQHITKGFAVFPGFANLASGANPESLAVKVGRSERKGMIAHSVAFHIPRVENHRVDIFAAIVALGVDTNPKAVKPIAPDKGSRKHVSAIRCLGKVQGHFAAHRDFVCVWLLLRICIRFTNEYRAVSLERAGNVNGGGVSRPGNFSRAVPVARILVGIPRDTRPPELPLGIHLCIVELLFSVSIVDTRKCHRQ